MTLYIMHLSRVTWGKVQTDVLHERHRWNWFLGKRRICQDAQVWSVVVFLLMLDLSLFIAFDGLSSSFWCAAGLSLRFLTGLCQRASQKTPSGPWWRLQASMTKRKSHGRTSISSCGTTRRICSLLNSMSKVGEWKEEAHEDVFFKSSSLWPCLLNYCVSAVGAGMEKQGRKRLSRDQRVSFISPANR